MSEQEERKRLTGSVFENMPGGGLIYEAEGDGRILAVNHKLLEIFECADRAEFDALTEGTFAGMILKEDRAEALSSIWDQQNARMDSMNYVGYRIETKSGRIRYVENFGKVCADPYFGRIYVVYLIDADVKFLTFDTDPLTRLPGMHRFLDYTSRFTEINRTNPNAQVYDFLYFNLVNFKTYNIRNGAEEGDDLLKAFAQILREAYPNSPVSRLGDDHFAVFTDDDSASKRIREVQRRMDLLAPDHPVRFKAGIFRMTKPESSQRCLDYAKTACDSIRTQIDKDFCFYDPKVHQHLLAQEYAEEHLGEAIRKGWIEVYYQPVVRPTTRKVASFEALARWNDPERGMLSPADFIPALEKSRQIDRLDACMIDLICKNMAEQVKQGLPVIPVSFNLSRLDFFLQDMFEVTETAVKRWNVDRANLFVEVTESVFTQDTYVISNVLERFRKAGYRIWIDDFGSGYSSLNVLKDYHFDVLKIDMAFLSSFTPTARTIIHSVVKMSERIGIEPLAEGAETREQVEFLMNTGCPLIQGYYFSRPLPYAEAVDLCKKKGLLPESLEERQNAWKAYEMPPDGTSESL